MTTGGARYLSAEADRKCEDWSHTEGRVTGGSRRRTPRCAGLQGFWQASSPGGDLPAGPGSHQRSHRPQWCPHVHETLPGELWLRHPEVRPAGRALRGGHPDVRRLHLSWEKGLQLRQDCQGEAGLILFCITLNYDLDPGAGRPGLDQPGQPQRGDAHQG